MRILLLTFLLLVGTEVHANVPIGKEKHTTISYYETSDPMWMVSEEIRRASILCQLKDGERYWNERKCTWADFLKAIDIDIIVYPSESEE